MTVEVLTGVLVLIVAMTTTAMLALGVAGLLGVVRFTRCEQCRRLGVVLAAQEGSTCMHCRHPLLLHPGATWRRSHPVHH